MSSLKIIFAGTPEFSVPSLIQLQESKHEILAVLTQPDRPAGRGRKLRTSPVKETALEHNLEVLQPTTLKNPEIQSQLSKYQADVMIVVAYGLILPELVLAIPAHGCLNIHASLLPRWRGAAPIHRAILAGDETSGITIMQMDKGLDTGDMLAVETCPISSSTRTIDLHDQLAEMGANLLLETLDKLSKNKLKPQSQDNSKACYAKKLLKSEAKIPWHSSAKLIDQMIRAFNPWPVAQTSIESKTCKIWHAAIMENSSKNSTSNTSPGKVVNADKSGIQVQTGDGIINILELQMSGSTRMSVEAFLNAHDIHNLVLESE